MRSLNRSSVSIFAGLFVLAAMLFAPSVAQAQSYVTPVEIIAVPVEEAGPLAVPDVTIGDGTGVVGDDDEVLGISQTAGGSGSGGGLAITGSGVSVPVAVGAALIGSGGVLIAAARKRQSNS